MRDRCTCAGGGAIGVNGKLSCVTVKNQELAFWEDLIRVPTVGGHYGNTDESSGRKCPMVLSGKKEGEREAEREGQREEGWKERKKEGGREEIKRQKLLSLL